MTEMTETTVAERKTLKIGEKNYYEDSLPDKVKQLIQIYSKWNTDVVEARLEVSKNEAAIRDVYREILEAVVDLKSSDDVIVEDVIVEETTDSE